MDREVSFTNDKRENPQWRHNHYKQFCGEHVAIKCVQNILIYTWKKYFPVSNRSNKQKVVKKYQYN